MEFLHEDNILLKFKFFNIFKKISLEEKTTTYLETYINYLTSKNINLIEMSSIPLPKELELLSQIQIEKMALSDAKVYIQNLTKIEKIKEVEPYTSYLSTVSNFLWDHKGLILLGIGFSISAYFLYKYLTNQFITTKEFGENLEVVKQTNETNNDLLSLQKENINNTMEMQNQIDYCINLRNHYKKVLS